MTKSRVLIVDDAVVFRRLLSETISSDPELEVVASAVNGVSALQKLATIPVDAVILDVEMPDLDGIATLKELRKTHPRLPVLMFSSLTERGAEATLDALSLGANDYFPKPTSSSMEASLAVVRDQLIPKLKAVIAQEARRAANAQSPSSRAASPLVAAPSTSPVELLVVAASTGGPNALLEFFGSLPANLPVPVAVVQHMPPMFTKLLAERLDSQCNVHVVEAAGGETLEPGCVYIAPGNFHMVVQRKGTSVVTALNQLPPENSCRPAVDPLFRSVSQVYGAHVLGVVLTGMGQDGLRGAEDIRAAGGQVLAQDEASSVVWGMPGFVAKANLADRILPLQQMAGELIRRTAPVFRSAAAVGGR